jgi:hypothetical protein
MPCPPGRLYGVRLMGPTPIYDQLRGERINADIPATAAVPQLVDQPGKHHLPAVASGPVSVFGPSPGPGTDLDGNRQHLPVTYPTAQPVGDGRPVPARGPRAGLAMEVHARQTPPHAASSSPALPGANHDPAGQGAATGEQSGHRGEKGGPRQVQHTEPRPATPAVAQFPWFDVDHDAGYSLSDGR